MIRTSSVRGSEEMEDYGVAASIECITPEECKEWIEISFKATVRRDPEDNGSVQVEQLEYGLGYSPINGIKLPAWKKIIKKFLNI